MENLNNKKKLRTVLITAIFGGVLFAGFTLAVIVGHEYWGRGTAGEPGPDTFLALEAFIGRPADIVINDGTKFGQWLLHQPSDLIIYTIIISVNGLLGALIFLIPALFWQLIKKYKYEHKN